DERAARDHLGVKPRAARDEPQEVPTVAVGPVHHRRNTQAVRINLLNIGLFIYHADAAKWPCAGFCAHAVHTMGLIVVIIRARLDTRGVHTDGHILPSTERQMASASPPGRALPQRYLREEARR